MNGKSIPSDFPRVVSAASRLFSFIDRRRLKRWLGWLGALLFVFLCAFIEFQTSALQSWIFTSTNERLFFKPGDGPSNEIAFPRSAPFDDRRGYSKLSVFQARLEAQKYRVTRQVRQSETMRTVLERGISPPYPEWPAAGLEVRGSDGASLFRYGQAEFLFDKTAGIPPLLVKTLLFLENRALANPATRWQNPVIEWDRTLKAAMMYVGAKLNLPVPVQGGSTLAVQLEKFRHSPNGRTDTPLEKLRQIIGAGLSGRRQHSSLARADHRRLPEYCAPGRCARLW